MRFARARTKSVEAAMEMLRSDLSYRVARGGEACSREAFLSKSAESIMEDGARRAVDAGRLGAEAALGGAALLAEYCRHMHHGFLGWDKARRPVMYRGFHVNTRLAQVIELGVDLTTMVRYNEWVIEKMVSAMNYQGQWVIVFDLGGLGIREFDRNGLGWTRRMAYLDAAHYPERLGCCFIINAPAFLSFFWRGVSSWIDEKTRNKVGIFAGESEWRQPMSEVFDLQLMPVHLGGSYVFSPRGLELGALPPRPRWAPPAVASRQQQPLVGGDATKPATRSFLKVHIVTAVVAAMLAAYYASLFISVV